MAEFRGLFKTPCFYYGLISLILLSLVYFGVNRFPKTIIWQSSNYSNVAEAAFFSSVSKNNSSNSVQQQAIYGARDGVLFLNQSQSLFLEPPELKIIQNDCLAAFAPPRVLSQKVLGALFGQGEQLRKEITEYIVKPGDTLKSIAQNFDISLDTLLWANNLTQSSKIKTGQKLIILPVSGAVHLVKSGDTLNAIAKTYKANVDDIVDFNELADESDVYIGDILVIPNGVMPKRPPTYGETYLADSYFKFPVQGKISQILHWYNGVDIKNKCGTPIFAAAAGVVLKTKYGWNGGGGNVITISHGKGVVSYYGHLEVIKVNSGDTVNVGQLIGFMGGQPGMNGAGISTGCHLHFTVIGAKNPFGKLPFGYEIKYVPN